MKLTYKHYEWRHVDGSWYPFESEHDLKDAREWNVTMRLRLPNPEYLGDGVYGSFDGYQIWLAANDHRNKVIALEPSVIAALNDYWRKVKEFYSND